MAACPMRPGVPALQAEALVAPAPRYNGAVAPASGQRLTWPVDKSTINDSKVSYLD